MSITIYSAISALIWFNLFVLLFYFLRRNLGILLSHHYLPLMILVTLSVFRLLAPVETQYTTVLRSYHLLPPIQNLLKAKVIQVHAFSLSFGAVIMCICSLISFFLVLRLLRALKTEAKKIDAIPKTTDNRLLQIFQEVKDAAPSKRKCDLLISVGDDEPFIFGLVHSRIVFPASMMDFSDEDLHFILKHEWQHHLDLDSQLKIFIEFLCNFLWWNPFIYLLRHNLNQTLELKCDKKITKDLTPPEKLHYTESFARVMHHRCKGDTIKKEKTIASIYHLGAVLPRNGSTDEWVIQRFDMVNAGKEKKTAGVLCVAVVVALFCLSFFFVIQPFTLPPEDELYSDTTSYTEIQVDSITPENSYLLDNMDGTYSLYIDESIYMLVEAEELKQKPYALLPIKTKNP